VAWLTGGEPGSSLEEPVLEYHGGTGDGRAAAANERPDVLGKVRPMAAKPPTIEPAAAPIASESETPVRPLFGRLSSWLRGDRYMVDAYPPSQAADVSPPEREH
jgi:hypothetical protein